MLTAVLILAHMEGVITHQEYCNLIGQNSLGMFVVYYDHLSDSSCCTQL